MLHVDMDAFFASVEVLDDPSLAGRPIAVGGDGSRGAVASCSYEARARGVRSAMATAEARRCCPDLVVVAPRHHRYVEVSHELHRVLRDITALVEPVGLDEAFVDVSGVLRRGSPPTIGRYILRQVHASLGLTCAVGVARTKSLAKLASRRAKGVAPADRGPGDGLFVVMPQAERCFLDPLPVTELWGVGPATAERLARYGVHQVADLAAMPPATLRRLVGRSAGERLAALARGCDTTPVRPSRPVKSIGRETTVAQDLFEPADLADLAARLARPVGAALVAQDLAARAVTVKVRFADRRTITRTTALVPPATGARGVVEASLELLGGVEITGGVRLLGVAASSLVPRGAVVEQLRLIPEGTGTGQRSSGRTGGSTGGATRLARLSGDGVSQAARDGSVRPPPSRWQRVDDVLRMLQHRYGAQAVRRAADPGPCRADGLDADVVMARTLRED